MGLKLKEFQSAAPMECSPIAIPHALRDRNGDDRQ
jgi:hypothetical protein